MTSQKQRETVVGVFSDRTQAQQAIEQLKSAGFRAEDIGILMQDKQGAKDLAGDTGTKAGQAAGAGATTGGILGAIGGLLVGLGALAIPGIGPVIAAGPLVAALGPLVGGTATGALIGAGTGALAGALIGLGIPDEEAHLYEDRFRAGGILVTVKSGANRFGEAQQILRRAGAEDIQSGMGSRSGSMAQGQMNTQGQTMTSGQSNMQTQATGNETVRVPLVEESLSVNKGMREAGQVEVRKNVREEQVNVPVNLQHEEVTITRHAVDRPTQEGDATLEDGQVIRVPIHEETAQVQKQSRVKEEVEIQKQMVSEQRNVTETVRHEEIDLGTGGQVQSPQGGMTGGTSSTTRTSNMSTEATEDMGGDTPYRPEGGSGKKR